MEKDIVGGPLGTVGSYDLKFAGGKLVFEIKADVAIGGVGLVMEIDSGHLLDAIAAAIPGKIDDAVIGVIKASLLGV